MFKLARFITQLNRMIGYWISFCVLIIFALLLADVVMRYLIGQPAIWTAELATLIFGVYAIIGGGYLLTERGHVNVDIIYGQFSPKRKALVDIVTWPLFLIFVGVLLWQGYDIASEAIADMERSNSVWKAPLWPTKSLIPVAALLLPTPVSLVDRSQEPVLMAWLPLFTPQACLSHTHTHTQHTAGQVRH